MPTCSARQLLPLDLIGMGADELGGLGEVPPGDVAATISGYRFMFSPIRHTSLGLGILEAMAAGVPVIGLATSELATVVSNGVNGFVHTDVEQVYDGGVELLDDRPGTSLGCCGSPHRRRPLRAGPLRRRLVPAPRISRRRGLTGAIVSYTTKRLSGTDAAARPTSVLHGAQKRFCVTVTAR